MQQIKQQFRLIKKNGDKTRMLSMMDVQIESNKSSSIVTDGLYFIHSFWIELRQTEKTGAELSWIV